LGWGTIRKLMHGEEERVKKKDIDLQLGIEDKHLAGEDKKCIIFHLGSGRVNTEAVGERKWRFPSHRTSFGAEPIPEF